jgi:hypothetical protein
MKEMREFDAYVAQREKFLKGEVDYRKKHGALEEMRQIVGRHVERRTILRIMEEQNEGTPLGSPDSHALDYEPPAPDKSPSSTDLGPVKGTEESSDPPPAVDSDTSEDGSE